MLSLFIRFNCLVLIYTNIFNHFNIAVPRSSIDFTNVGNEVTVENAQPGDLAFFNNETGKIIHVGIILKDNRIIHSSGKVRIDKIDHFGIHNPQLKKYSHQLKIIKRMF